MFSHHVAGKKATSEIKKGKTSFNFQMCRENSKSVVCISACPSLKPSQPPCLSCRRCCPLSGFKQLRFTGGSAD